MENVENQNVEARRSFLKKVAYVAPAVVALGALNAHASVSAGAAPSTFVNTWTDNHGATQTVTVSGYSKTGEVTGGTINGTPVSAANVVTPPMSNFFAWFKQWFPSIG